MPLQPRSKELGSEPQFDRLIVIFSDIEMGAGGDTDDFPHSEFLARQLLAYQNGPFRDIPVDFVFNIVQNDRIRIRLWKARGVSLPTEDDLRNGGCRA